MVGFICLSLILVLSLSVVSAGWFGDFFDKISGRQKYSPAEVDGEPTCIDTDGGWNYTIKGTCTDTNGVHVDECQSSTSAGDYRCTSPYGPCQGSGYSCSYHYGDNYVCEDGACVEASYPPTCIDTDGQDYTIKGNCTDINGVYVDGCGSLTSAQDYRCTSPYGLCQSTGRSCTYWAGDNYVCEDGACVEGSGPPTCIDSDAGDDRTTKGNCTDINGVYVEECTSSTFLAMEYYCPELYGLCRPSERSCSILGENYVCEDGACVEASYPPTCTDTNGLDVTIEGICTDPNGAHMSTCKAFGVINDYTCTYDYGYCHASGRSCPVDHSCQDGICILSDSIDLSIVSYINSVITDNDFFLFNGEDLIWRSYSSFNSLLEIKKNEILFKIPK